MDRDVKLRYARRLYKETEEEIIEIVRDFVARHDNFIDTRNINEECDTIYAGVWNDTGCDEYPVIAVRIKYNNLQILVNDGNMIIPEDDAEFRKMCDENNHLYWYNIYYGSEVVLGMTLNYLLEGLDEYVEE